MIFSIDTGMPQDIEIILADENLGGYVPEDVASMYDEELDTLMFHPEQLDIDDGNADEQKNSRKIVNKVESLQIEAEVIWKKKLTTITLIWTYFKTKNVGDFEFKVESVPGYCQFSETQKYWHILRNRGTMMIKTRFTGNNWRPWLRTVHLLQYYLGVPRHGSNYLLRATLFRKNEKFKHFPVNTMCETHKNDFSSERSSHVLQAGTGEIVISSFWINIMFVTGYREDDESDCVYSLPHQGLRRSVSFLCPAPDTSGTLEKTIRLKFMCNASCGEWSFFC